MHPRKSMGAFVSRVLSVLRVMLPFSRRRILMRRVKPILRLVTTYTWLPPTSWDTVEKHGENVSYGTHRITDLLTKEHRTPSVWVVDYRRKTLRWVWGVPEEYEKPGTAF